MRYGWCTIGVPNVAMWDRMDVILAGLCVGLGGVERDFTSVGMR